MVHSRGKMKVLSVDDSGYEMNGEFILDSQLVKFGCEYDESNPEDVAFSKATPSGAMEMRVSNPALLGTYQIGQCFYLELHPA